MDKHGICIVAYNRPKSLIQLLNSLSLLKETKICFDLVISIDHCSDELIRREISSIIDNYTWSFGEKVTIKHNNNLGLKKHIYTVGDYMAENYSAFIMLEDDLYVSAYMLQYYLELFSHYNNDNMLAGFSLYSPRFNETSLLPFEPVNIFSPFLVQLPCSWGQSWSSDQWKTFRTFDYKGNKKIETPHNISRWSGKSWKKEFYNYLALTNKFILYPPFSFTTNTGATGEHMNDNNLFNEKLVNEKFYVDFVLTKEMFCYDGYLEMMEDTVKKIAPFLSKYNFLVDLRGQKSVENNKLLLTLTKADDVLYSFPLIRYPAEFNLLSEPQQGYKENSIYLVNKPTKLTIKSRIKIFLYENKLKFSLGLIKRILLSYVKI